MGNFDLYFPWDKGFGTPASTSMWRKMAQLWCSDGVVAGYQSSLNCTLSGTTITVNPGACFLHGYYAEVVNAQTLTGVGTNGTVVAKADLVNEVCSIYYKDGATDYNGYEQDANAWEIPLWLVSGSTLTDLRTMINPGGALTWWNTLPGPSSIAANQTAQYNFVTARVPYVGHALLVGSLILTFTDASIAQTAACTMTYQYGVSGEQAVSPTITRTIPGTGVAGSPLERDVSMTALIPVSALGKKNVGWRVTAGTGTAAISVASLMATMMLTGFPPAA